jgi:predicted ATPase
MTSSAATPIETTRRTGRGGVRVGGVPCRCGEKFHGTRLIAVTGGPGAGKTAILEMALRVFCEHVGVLPEAAGVVFGGGFPRSDTLPARRAAQRAIFHIQDELEAAVVEEEAVGVALCDRGTVDGAAYWPGTTDEYWAELGTTKEHELARYAAVIHMRTPDLEHGYNHQNELRVESAREARALDDRILNAWDGHPCRLVVVSEDDFLVKAGHALALVREHLPACCRTHPLPGEDAERIKEGAS